MKRLIVLAALSCLIGCSSEHDSVLSPSAKAQELTPAVALTGADSCIARNIQVAVYVSDGGVVPTILTLSNGRQVYLLDTGTPPYYQATDYPSPWCVN